MSDAAARGDKWGEFRRDKPPGSLCLLVLVLWNAIFGRELATKAGCRGQVRLFAKIDVSA
jgi:hypothetical protein